jgi:hypothetical protein
MSLLDHLIGTTKQGERCVKSESLRGLKIDNHLKLRGLDNRKVGRVLSLEDSASIVSNLPKQVGIVGAIAHQTSRKFVKLAAQRIVSTYQNGTWVINEHFKARLEIQWQFAHLVHRSRRVARFDWRILATPGPDAGIRA